jgi:hypothetical protein
MKYTKYTNNCALVILGDIQNITQSNFKITLSGEIIQISMTLPKGHGQKASTSGKRSFEDWWRTVPEDLRSKSRKGDEGNKPLLNQVNYVLLHLHLAGKHDAKPSHEELKDWLHSGQVDVLRMSAAVAK